jgi:hypothetical protein
MSAAFAGRFTIPTDSHATTRAFTTTQMSIPRPALTCFARRLSRKPPLDEPGCQIVTSVRFGSCRSWRPPMR